MSGDGYIETLCRKVLTSDGLLAACKAAKWHGKVTLPNEAILAACCPVCYGIAPFEQEAGLRLEGTYGHLSGCILASAIAEAEGKLA